MAKPFVKWAGGKGKLLNTLDSHLPKHFAEEPAITYIEPFVGGGAMLFHMLESHPNITRVIINDINPELMSCYQLVRDEPDNLITQLQLLENDFNALNSQEERKAHFYAIRNAYNEMRANPQVMDLFAQIEKAAYFIYLNRTCFNGLYRENRNGNFNVPFGSYANPTICNEANIKTAHDALQNVTLLCGNYHDVMQQVRPEENNFFYFDPPYRPLLGSSNFKDYTRFEFGDHQQEELRDFCNEINAIGGRFMLSNSDSMEPDGTNYFENIYAGYHFHRVYAPRVINAFAAGRVPQSEVLITNYEECHA